MLTFKSKHLGNSSGWSHSFITFQKLMTRLTGFFWFFMGLDRALFQCQFRKKIIRNIDLHVPLWLWHWQCLLEILKWYYCCDISNQPYSFIIPLIDKSQHFSGVWWVWTEPALLWTSIIFLCFARPSRRSCVSPGTMDTSVIPKKDCWN